MISTMRDIRRRFIQSIGDWGSTPAGRYKAIFNHIAADVEYNHFGNKTIDRHTRRLLKNWEEQLRCARAGEEYIP